MSNIPFFTNVFGKRHVFHQLGQTGGVKGTNLLEIGDFVSLSELSAKDRGKLSIPTSKSAPYAFVTIVDQQQFKNIDVQG